MRPYIYKKIIDKELDRKKDNRIPIYAWDDPVEKKEAERKGDGKLPNDYGYEYIDFSIDEIIVK